MVLKISLIERKPINYNLSLRARPKDFTTFEKKGYIEKEPQRVTFTSNDDDSARNAFRFVALHYRQFSVPLKPFSPHRRMHFTADEQREEVNRFFSY